MLCLQDKKYATDKYKDIYTELSIVKAKAERDLGRLREQLQLAHEALGEQSLEDLERGGYGTPATPPRNGPPSDCRSNSASDRSRDRYHEVQKQSRHPEDGSGGSQALGANPEVKGGSERNDLYLQHLCRVPAAKPHGCDVRQQHFVSRQSSPVFHPLRPEMHVTVICCPLQVT